MVFNLFMSCIWTPATAWERIAEDRSYFVRAYLPGLQSLITFSAAILLDLLVLLLSYQSKSWQLWGEPLKHQSLLLRREILWKFSLNGSCDTYSQWMYNKKWEFIRSDAIKSCKNRIIKESYVGFQQICQFQMQCFCWIYLRCWLNF